MIVDNKSVVITGGSDGLGLSLSQAFVKKGATVHIVARSKKQLDRAVKTINSRLLHAHLADVSNFSQLKKAAKAINRVDVLINNAGVWIEGQLRDNKHEDISKTIDVNLKGVIYSTKVFLSLLQKSKEAHIVNICSTSGLKGRFNQSVYVASKFGVSGFTDSIKEDLKDTNIKVTGFYPGGMKTKFFEKKGSLKENKDWMDTNKIAQILINIVEQDDTLVIDNVVLNRRKTKSNLFSGNK